MLFLICFANIGAQAETLLREALTAGTARQVEIADELTTLPRSAYNAPAEALLGQLLASESFGSAPTYIKLTGFLGREDLLGLVIPDLRERDDVRRAIKLARVRAGNTALRDNLLKNLYKIEINDDFVYTVVPLLVYTRDQEVLDFLWELVITENRNCHPADAESAGTIDCAYRIVEYLGVAIVDFPVKIDDGNNLVTTDYAGALAEIRRWYAANSNAYTIDTQTY